MNKCGITNGWFDELGDDSKEKWKRIWDDELDVVKINILKNLWGVIWFKLLLLMLSTKRNLKFYNNYIL